MTTKYCKNCGNQLQDADIRFCSNCGAQVVHPTHQGNVSEATIAENSTKHQESGRGTLILVLGILSYWPGFGPLTGIPAWFMGNKDLKKIERGLIPISEKMKTKVGMILGQIITYLFVFIPLFLILFFREEVMRLMGID
ncbi:MAG: zinc ribbon domain-containing protein [Bacteroidetes bacterium]|nr:zinc ribbon domain-containing protein [Bacteroidota bacterium]MBU2586241.1 zinc ribbon domain-containing protein [Bacteroidota bacterium]